MVTTTYTVNFNKDITIGIFDTLDMAILEFGSAVDYIKESGDFESVNIVDDNGEIFDEFVA